MSCPHCASFFSGRFTDVASGKVTVLKDIPSDNCFGPVWSPDGTQLAFSIMAEKEWHLGLANAYGSGFRFVKNAELKSEAFGAPEWARDGKSIFCHDLENLYQIDLDGNVLKKWELSKILTDASMNSNDRLSVPPDGKALLMDVDCGAEHERKLGRSTTGDLQIRSRGRKSRACYRQQ